MAEKELRIFDTKLQIAYDLMAMLNSRVSDGLKYRRMAERLCRRYTRARLASLWRRTAEGRIAKKGY